MNVRIMYVDLKMRSHMSMLGGSHGNPVYRHGITTPSPWPPGLAPVVPYVHKVSAMTSGRESRERHVVKQPLQCTNDPSVAAASGPVEETGTTSTALVVALSNSKVNASAVDLYEDHTKDCVKLAKIQMIEALCKKGHFRVHRCAPFPCEFKCSLLCTLFVPLVSELVSSSSYVQVHPSGSSCAPAEMRWYRRTRVCGSLMPFLTSSAH